MSTKDQLLDAASVTSDVSRLTASRQKFDWNVRESAKRKRFSPFPRQHHPQSNKTKFATDGYWALITPLIGT